MIGRLDQVTAGDSYESGQQAEDFNARGFVESIPKREIGWGGHRRMDNPETLLRVTTLPCGMPWRSILSSVINTLASKPLADIWLARHVMPSPQRGVHDLGDGSAAGRRASRSRRRGTSAKLRPAGWCCGPLTETVGSA